MKTKILCIFDGFGLNVASANNAISRAKMPNLRRLLKENFWTTLSADGESVGQEGGLVGNSEVGHMNIGGLKLVPQLSYQITKSSQSSFDLDKTLTPDQLFDPKNFLEQYWKKQNNDKYIRISTEEIQNLLKECQNPQNKKVLQIVQDVMVDWLHNGRDLSTATGINYEYLKKEPILYFFTTLYRINSTPENPQLLNDNEPFLTEGFTKENLIKVINDQIINYDLFKNYLQRILPIYDNFDSRLSFLEIIDQVIKQEIEQRKLELATPVSYAKFPLNKETEKTDQTAKSKTIHLAGLFSTGAIHSDLRHWVGSTEASLKAGAEKVVLHLMTDGRDSDKKSLVATWQIFEKMLTESLDKAGIFGWQSKIWLGSVGGRFFAMDRDQNWARVWQGLSVMFAPFALSQHNLDGQVSTSEQKLTDLLSQKYKLDLPKLPTQSQETTSKFIRTDSSKEIKDLNHLTDFLQQTANRNYQQEQFDEMIVPERVLYENPNSEGSSKFESVGIESGQVVWLINFRSDRMKQFTTMLCDLNKELDLDLTILANNSFGIKLEKFLNADLEFDETINRYKQMPNYDYQEGQYYPVFKPQTVKNTLAQMISQRPQNSQNQETIEQLRQIQKQFMD